jgi:hypothetical protein
MQVTVQVSRAAAVGLHRQVPATPESLGLEQLAAELGIRLRPQHPESHDPTLQTYFVAEIPDGPGGDRIIERLRGAPAVLGAYVKPLEAMP